MGTPLKALSVMSALSALAISIFALVAIGAFLRGDFLAKVVDQYPAELVITIKDGVASANVEQPYFIYSTFDTDSSTSTMLAVVDTRQEVTVGELNSYEAPVILTQKKLYFEGTDEGRSADFANVKSLTIDRAAVQNLGDTVRPFISGALYLVPVLLFFLLLGVFILGYMFSALFAALIVMLFAKFKGLSFDYRTSYVTALFALIPVSILDLLTDLVGFGNSFLLTLAVFIAVVLINVRQDAPAAPPAQEL